MIYSQEILNKRKMYYSKIFVQFELLKAMKNKEVMFMSKSNNRFCIRGLFISNIEMLNKIFDIFHFFEKDYNIYVSCANYAKLPLFPFDLSERSKFTNEFFNKDCFKQIYDYDILLDFDIETNLNFNIMLQDVRKIWQILYNNSIIFNCFFSGSGIQIIIPSKQINLKKDFFKFDSDIFETTQKQPFNYKIKLLTTSFKKKFNLKSLCLKGIGTISKVRKCEYSLVSDSVCLPVLNLGTMETLAKNRFDLKIILNQIILKNRGLIYHNSDNDLETDYFNLFLEKYNFKEDFLKW